MDDIGPEMKRLLDFIDGKEPADDFTMQLADAVRSVRDNEKWRLDYMTLQMSYQEKFEQGVEQGLKKGLEQGLAKGLEKGKLLSAKKMIEAGKLSTNEIVLYSGLSLEQVLALKSEMIV